MGCDQATPLSSTALSMPCALHGYLTSAEHTRKKSHTKNREFKLLLHLVKLQTCFIIDIIAKNMIFRT